MRRLLLLVLAAPQVDAGSIVRDLKEITEFVPTEPAAHVTNVKVGLFFEHLIKVSDTRHTFEADFYLTQRWQDPRNYSALFSDPDIVELESASCDHDSKILRRLAAAAPPTGGPVRRYVEFGHSEMDLIYRPDIHIANEHMGNEAIHEELMRLYEDGTVELVYLMWAEIEFHGHYYAFPFDKQRFGIYVDSMSHTSKRITVETFDEMTGVDVNYVKDWLGWTYDKHEATSKNYSAPEYVAINDCRAERRAKFTFYLDVSRITSKFFDEVFLPSIAFIVISWLVFFVDPHDVFSRIGLGFLVLLVLTSWGSTFLSKFHTDDYPVWFDIFFFACFILDLVTIILCIISNRVAVTLSTRVALSLDKFCKAMCPLVSTAMLITLFAVEKNQQTVQMLRTLALCTSLTVPVALAYTAFEYRQFRRRICAAPMLAYAAEGVPPLDDNELRMIFTSIDTDKGGTLSVSELCSQLVAGDTTDGVIKMLTDKYSDVRVSPDAAEVEFTREKFVEHHKNIFEQLRLSLSIIGANAGNPTGPRLPKVHVATHAVVP